MKKDEKNIESSSENKAGTVAALIIFIIGYIGLSVISNKITSTSGTATQEGMSAIAQSVGQLGGQLSNPNIPAEQTKELINAATEQATGNASAMMTKITKNSAIAGTIAQIQVMLCVFVTLATRKKGYIIAICTSVAMMVPVIINIVTLHLIQAIPGIIVPMATLILLTIIYISSEKISKQKDEINKSYLKTLETNKVIKEKDEILTHLAYYDILTDLPNRHSFIERLDETIINSSNTPFTVILADLDGFKMVNDRYGNNTGDALLNTYAEKLKTFCQDTMFLSRLGGDEFGFIIEGSLSEQNILNYIEKLKNIISEPVQINDAYIQLAVSFGIASYPTNAVTSTDILACINSAVFYAKSNGGNRPCFYGQQ